MNVTPWNKDFSTDLTQGFRLAGKIWVPFRRPAFQGSRWVGAGLLQRTDDGYPATTALSRKAPGSAAVGSQQGVGRGSIHDFNPILPIEVRVVGLEEPKSRTRWEART